MQKFIGMRGGVAQKQVERVLIVDDDPTVRTMLSIIMTRRITWWWGRPAVGLRQFGRWKLARLP